MKKPRQLNLVVRLMFLLMIVSCGYSFAQQGNTPERKSERVLKRSLAKTEKSELLTTQNTTNGNVNNATTNPAQNGTGANGGTDAKAVVAVKNTASAVEPQSVEQKVEIVKTAPTDEK